MCDAEGFLQCEWCRDASAPLTKGYKRNPTPRQASRPADASGCGDEVRRGLEGWLGSPVLFGGGRPARSDAAIKERDPRRGGGGVSFSSGRPPLRKQRLRRGTGAAPQPEDPPKERYQRGQTDPRPRRGATRGQARPDPPCRHGDGPAPPRAARGAMARPRPRHVRGAPPPAGADVDGTHNAWREVAAVAGRRCRRRSAALRLSLTLLAMSMILSASVVRVRDGLPLSASTDYDQSTGMQECRKYFKMLSKKLSQLPDRCTLKTGQYNINFISSLGVSYMMLCTENYPSVLAFCFLDELQKEFITTYNMMKTNTAVRPYCFIEFDNFIQRTKQRYNNTRSLSTKMNLADMQTEIKLRPPYQISVSELGSANGFAHLSVAEYKCTGKISAAPHQRLEPVTLPGIVSFVLSLLCGALNLIRGFHAIESLLQNEGEDFSYVIAFFLGTAACLYQCYLFVYYTGWRNAKSFLTFGLICLCNMYLYELRNLWQLFFHVTVGAFSTLQIRLRQPQGKSPDYNV